MARPENTPPRSPGVFADIRYCKVTSITDDPESGTPSEIQQPVRVKLLHFADGYSPASSGTVSTTNTDIEIKTRESGPRHGDKGNGIIYDFTVDGGITENSEATFDDSTETLHIKVKGVTVKWLDVQYAASLPLEHGFELFAVDPNAEVGASISSVTGTLSGGVAGGYTIIGNEFGIGDHATKDEVAVDDKLWIIWRPDAKRWERFTSGGGATPSTGRFCRVKSAEGITPATSHLSDGPGTSGWGSGMVEYLDNSTGALSGSDVAVTNRWPRSIPLDALAVDFGNGNIIGICSPAPPEFWETT